MQRCPKCGVRNLDSDIICFNCEDVLSGQPIGDIDAVKAAVGATPEVERKVRRPKTRKSFIGLVLGAWLNKLFLLLLAAGLFSIASLLAMWIAYNNNIAAVVSFGVLGAAAAFALVYPDIARARLNGRQGGFVALLSDLLVLMLFLPPLLLVERKVSGAAGYILDYYWVIIAFLAAGFLVGLIFGYRAWRRDKGLCPRPGPESLPS